MFSSDKDGKIKGNRWLTHIFGEALRQHDLVSLFDEVAESVRVVVDVTGGEALVRHVEEWEQFLLFHDLQMET